MPSYAMSTSELYSYCSANNEKENSIAIGYVVGIADDNLTRSKNGVGDICIPRGTDRKDLFDRVCEFIGSNKNTLDFLGAYTVRKALKEFYPCGAREFETG
jgi:Rap1a immunity proteins